MDRSYRYWPFLMSFDLVRASKATALECVMRQISRFTDGDPLTTLDFRFESLSQVFVHPGDYASVPTALYVLPTRTPWSVIWTNTFHCNGYDSLCHCVSLFDRLETLHFSSCDEDAFYQAGTQLTHRVPKGEKEVESRTVQAFKDDSRWQWYAAGPEQPYENAKNYTSRRKRDRLNEAILADYLRDLGCDPRDEEVYDRVQAVTCIVRENPPSTITREPYSYVLSRCE